MRYEAREWMKDNRVTQQMVAERAGTSIEAVSAFIREMNNSPRIRQNLLDLGCPEELVPKEKKDVPSSQIKFRNPWTDGSIKGPFGVDPDPSLICPFE